MQVLVIEDSEIDFRLVERALDDQFDLTRATSLQRGWELLQDGHFDLLILDLSVDDSRGYETFAKTHAHFPQIPILILSGMDDDDLALRAVSEGAQDYVRKSRLLDYPLDRAARYAIERRRVQDQILASERKYHTLFDNLPVAAYTCDAQGLITYYNEKAVELWGRRPKLNDPADRYSGSYKLFSSDGVPIPHEQSLMARALQTRSGYNGLELRNETPDGARHVILGHANPIFDKDGELCGGMNVFLDITRQRQAEEKLRESERFARSIVNSLPQQIAILDEQGTILAVNTAWQKVADENDLGLPDYGVGSNYLGCCEKADTQKIASAVEAVRGIRSVLSGQRKSFYLEYPCDSKTEQLWMAMHVNRLDGDGPVRVVVSHENITSRKLAEKLAIEQGTLKAAVQSMDQVLGVVGHELRTPLATLRAISEYLCMSGARDTADADTFLNQITAEVVRMSETVDSLLEAARINSGRAKWTWTTVDLPEVANQAVESIKPLVDAAQVSLVLNIDPAIEPFPGDPLAIRRLLVNLLSNSRKHTESGRIEISAKRLSSSSQNLIEMRVTDTGSGIPADITARLGEAFALNSGVVGSNHVSGTGLGLAICRGIAEAHGGKITIQSTVGKGTTVRVLLRTDLLAPTPGNPLAEKQTRSLCE